MRHELAPSDQAKGGPSWLQQLAGSLRLGQSADVKPTRPKVTSVYTLVVDTAGVTATVAVHGRLTRRAIFGLRDELQTVSHTLGALTLDVGGARGLDARGLAMLAMLCGELERDRPNVNLLLTGLPDKLYLAAIEARLHHMVNLG